MFSAPTWADFVASWELFREPILCALAGGLVLGFLSVYVVLRRMVFLSAAVTQSAALGVALCFYADIHLGAHVDPLLGAGALALTATMLALADPRALRLTREALLGFAFAASGAAAVLVGDRISQEAHDIQAILFGTAVLVRSVDLWVVVTTAAAVLVLHLWWFRGLTFATFEPDSARVQGLPVRLLSAVVFVSMGLATGATARALGALPVFAMSTIPAIAAVLLGCRLRSAFVVAALIGAISGVGGYLFAFFRQFPVGGSQAFVAVVFMLAALAVRLARRFWGHAPPR